MSDFCSLQLQGITEKEKKTGNEKKNTPGTDEGPCQRRQSA